MLTTRNLLGLLVWVAQNSDPEVRNRLTWSEEINWEEQAVNVPSEDTNVGRMSIARLLS